ncbi:hypothetical protein R6Q59_014075 [Mikania micrantha]
MVIIIIIILSISTISKAKVGSEEGCMGNMQNLQKDKFYGAKSPFACVGPTAKMTSDEGPILINLDTNILGDARNTSGNMGFGEPQQFNDFSMNSPQEMQGSIEIGDHEGPLRLTSDDHEWVKVQTSGFPFSPPSTVPDDWNHDMPWDSPSNSINMC